MRTAGRSDVTVATGLTCLAVILVYAAGAIAATTVAVLDLAGQRTHLALDIVLLLIFGVPLLSSRIHTR